MAKSKKRKKKNGGRLLQIILIICGAVFVFALVELIMELYPYIMGNNEYDNVTAEAITIKDEDDTEDDSEEEDADRFKVDFDVLKAENSDTVGWIRFDEPSVISYPVVKSHDNNEYLTQTFSANDNKLGAIFMDMNCIADFSGKNTIIYGHHMSVGDDMFTDLMEYQDESFCKQNPYFYIYLPGNIRYTYQIFAAGVVKDDAINYTYEFASDDEYLQFLNEVKSASNYSVDVTLDKDSKVVTLSTCTNVVEDERFVVTGVRVKINREDVTEQE